MSIILTSADLRKMTSSQITKAFSRARKSESLGSRSERIKELRTEVKGYERQYNMSSQKMVRDVCSGKLKESGDFDAWLNSYNLLSVYEKAV